MVFHLGAFGNHLAGEQEIWATKDTRERADEDCRLRVRAKSKDQTPNANMHTAKGKASLYETVERICVY